MQYAEYCILLSIQNSVFRSFLLDKKKTAPLFINSDVIATGISPLNVDAAAFAAGRIMLETIRASIKSSQSFAFETTLSGKSWLPILSNAKNQGYEIIIYFLYLNNVQENLKRIKERMRRGGHSVSDETVKRRFPKSIKNFWTIYRPISDNWLIFNNSGNKPKLIQSMDLYLAQSTDHKTTFEKKFLLQANGVKR